MSAPEIIYLIKGEDLDGAPAMVWCDDPAPSYADDPAKAVKYVRADHIPDAGEVVADNSKVNAEMLAENGRLQVRIAELQQAAHMKQNLAIEWKVAKDKAEARVAELEAVTESVRDDLLLRAELDPDGTRCVNLSASKWGLLCDVIDASNSGAFIKRKQAEAVESAMENEMAEFRLHNGTRRSGCFAQDLAAYAQRLRNEAEKAGGCDA